MPLDLARSMIEPKKCCQNIYEQEVISTYLFSRSYQGMFLNTLSNEFNILCHNYSMT